MILTFIPTLTLTINLRADNSTHPTSISLSVNRMLGTVLCVTDLIAKQDSFKVLPFRSSALVWAGLV